MPLRPGKNEDKDTFISRAISELERGGRPHLQAIAIAQSMWRNRNKGSKH